MVGGEGLVGQGLPVGEVRDTSPGMKVGNLDRKPRSGLGIGCHQQATGTGHPCIGRWKFREPARKQEAVGRAVGAGQGDGLARLGQGLAIERKRR